MSWKEKTIMYWLRWQILNVPCDYLGLHHIKLPKEPFYASIDQNQLGSLGNVKLKLLSPNWLMQLVPASASVLSMTNRLGSLWNMKINLMGSQWVSSTNLGYPLFCISALKNHLQHRYSHIMHQINSDLYETWNSSFLGPKLLIQLILAIPSNT